MFTQLHFNFKDNMIKCYLLQTHNKTVEKTVKRFQWKIKPLVFSLVKHTNGKSVVFSLEYHWNNSVILNSNDFQWNNSDFDKNHSSNTNGKHCYTTVIPETFSMGLISE